MVLSLPGGPCLRCLGVATGDALGAEGRNYGAAGGKPQVVWPNGVLASTAIGLFMQVVTPWHGSTEVGACLEYEGNLHTVTPSERMARLRGHPCPHHPADALGDPTFDIRRVEPGKAGKQLKAGDADEVASPAHAQGQWWMRTWRGLTRKLTQATR